MAILSEAERNLAQAFSKLTYCNPFLRERIEFERDILGKDFVESEFVWSARAHLEGERPNIAALSAKAEELAEAMRSRLEGGQKLSGGEAEAYQDLVFYILYQRTRHKLNDLIVATSASAPATASTRKVDFYREYLGQLGHFFDVPGLKLEPRYDPPHLFASFFQVRRAFHYIFRHIVGGSMPAAQLRAAVWHSVFTGDMLRYLRILYDHMGDFTTLIVGPSGTGKELVARAIGLSRYIPFDPKTQSFAEDFTGSFHPLNLSALSPTLIESELFGHKRGAFTGALQDRAGWLEVCRPLGTVFLDEVGEIDAAIQVKLLRVLQTRTFQRLGDTTTRRFTGKIIAATNRDLTQQMQRGQIREDFYYRICSDIITTPALAEILRQSPDELHNMVLFIAQRVTDPRRFEDLSSPDPARRTVVNDEAERLAEEVEFWISHNMGREYPWPGNFRELEQCVRNILIRHEYRPALLAEKGARQSLAEAVCAGTLTADQLLCRYCTLVHSQTHNYEETARRLGLDRRTIKAKVNPELLEELGRK
ncbi:MAG TPA: sigma 54-interacting transcriptional regulator [Tepidisphaeraceae bacterium]|jgi:transcriptional regulator with AAA-type ATPase domain|nr:sigma 54-interacting transcriptional regulator [Tepidisphaeraceae bacterium]